MCRKDFDNKVKECGAAYGMDIYSDGELLSLSTGIAPEKFTGTLQETFDNPKKIDGIGKRKELVVFAVRELSKRYLKQQPRPNIIHGPEDSADFARQQLATEEKEHFCVMPYYTGMRIGEIFALRWEHIDLAKRTIRICENIVEAKDAEGKHRIIVGSPKTKRSNRTIKISQKLCEILKDMRPAIAGDTDIVFQSSAGGYIAPSNFARVWRRILRNIGMAGQYEMYEFRHTHATLLLATGRFSMASVQKRLGHESPQTTLKHYAHAIAAEDERMADAFDSEEY